MNLYDRICKVTMMRTVLTETEQRFFLPLPDSIEVTDLRMQFDIKKSLGKTPNSCELKITNLSPRTRAEVEGPPDGLVCRIAAGHNGVARHLFTGDVRLASSLKEGADWITTLQLADGGRAYGNARANRTYRAGTSMITVLKDAAKSMGLELPKELLDDPAMRAQFAAGTTLSGGLRDELTRVLAPFGYGWSIQDGQLTVLRDEDTVGVEREISEGTGMIGSPAFSPTKKTKKKAASAKMHASSILYPELTPGGRVSVIARATDGRFKISEVTHKGDTHGDEWTTEIEAKEIT